jgi:gluconokinase
LRQVDPWASHRRSSAGSLSGRRRFSSALQRRKNGRRRPLDDDDRWPWLDDVGAAIYANARACGVAVASCSALKRIYRDRLRAAAQAPIRFVCLTGAPDLLARRMAERCGHYMPPSLLISQLAILEAPASDEDAVVVDISEALDRQLEAALH